MTRTFRIILLLLAFIPSLSHAALVWNARTYQPPFDTLSHDASSYSVIIGEYTAIHENDPTVGPCSEVGAPYDVNTTGAVGADITGCAGGTYIADASCNGIGETLTYQGPLTYTCEGGTQCTWPMVEDTLNPGQCILYQDCPAGQEPDPNNEFQCLPSTCQQGNLQQVNYGHYQAFKKSDISLNVASPICIEACQYEVSNVSLEMAIKGTDCGTVNGELACGTPSSYILAINSYGTGNECTGGNTPTPQCTTCTTFDNNGDPAQPPEQLATKPETDKNKPTSTTSDTQTNPDGSKTKTDIKSYIDGSRHISITNYDANGNLISQESRVEGEGNQAELEAAGCDPDIEFCGSMPTSGTGLDTETDKTYEGALSDFSNRVKNSAAFGAVTGFFTINIATNSCPSWFLDVWVFSLDFDFFCSPVMDDLWPLISAILLATSGVLAFRIGVLDK